MARRRRTESVPQRIWRVVIRELFLLAAYVLAFVLIVAVLAPMEAHQLVEQITRH